MIKVFKQFLSPEECKTLNDIAFQGIQEGWVFEGVQDRRPGYKLRYTSRMHMKTADYPEFVYTISNRVREFLNIDQYPIIAGHGRNGVVVSVTFQNGSVYEHQDPRSVTGLGTYRCNILTQANENGADLHLNGEKIELAAGDLHCYFASEVPHSVSEALGPTPRILWMFGAHLPVNP